MKKTLLAILAASTLSGCGDDANNANATTDKNTPDAPQAMTADLDTSLFFTHKDKTAFFSTNKFNGVVEYLRRTFDVDTVHQVTFLADIKTHGNGKRFADIEGLTAETVELLKKGQQIQIKRDNDTVVAQDAPAFNTPGDYTAVIRDRKDLNDNNTADAGEANHIGDLTGQITQANANIINSNICNLAFGTAAAFGNQQEINIDGTAVAAADVALLMPAIAEDFFACSTSSDTKQHFAMAKLELNSTNTNATTVEMLADANFKYIYVNGSAAITDANGETVANQGVYYRTAHTAKQDRAAVYKRDLEELKRQRFYKQLNDGTVATAHRDIVTAYTAITATGQAAVIGAFAPLTAALKDFDADNTDAGSNNALSVAANTAAQAAALGANWAVLNEANGVDNHLVTLLAAGNIAKKALTGLPASTHLTAATALADGIVTFATTNNRTNANNLVALIAAANVANTTSYEGGAATFTINTGTAEVTMTTASSENQIIPLINQALEVLGNSVTELTDIATYNTAHTAAITALTAEGAEATLKTELLALNNKITRKGYRANHAQAEVALEDAEATVTETKAAWEKAEEGATKTTAKEAYDAAVTARNTARTDLAKHVTVIEKFDALIEAEKAAVGKTGTELTTANQAVTTAQTALDRAVTELNA